MAKKDKEEQRNILATTKPAPSSGTRKLLLSTDESLDDDCEIDLDEDEDEQHKTPLIKESKLKFTTKSSNNKKKKSVKFECNGKSNSIDDDDDEISSSSSSRSKHSLNTPPPITIGKIKIFKPSRRHRLLRVRRFLKHCISILFCVAFMLFLLFNAKNLPDIIRSAFGIQPFSSIISNKDKSIKCDHIVTKSVWQQNFPMLTIESALRLVDVNNDTYLDIIVPFGTGIDAAYYDDTLCQIYFNQTQEKSKTVGCGGGVMALNGINGEPIWAQYTPHEMFASNCNGDLNNDGIKDCIIGGRMASLFAFDGRTGRIFWSITSNYGEPVSETSNFYTPLIIPKDIDSDNVPEIVVMHGGDPLRKPNQRVRNVARLIVISGKTGQILKWSYVPNNAESYYSPQLLVHPDGTSLILYGTGGETHPGGLYVVGLEALLNGQIEHNSRAIYQDCCKGVIAPPVLIDINGDDVLDIILANFNSTIFAFDGFTFEQIWKHELPGSETYSTPSIGYFNEDDVPDFGVIYQFGPGFPIYYYTEFHILDGRNGKSLLKNPIRMSIGTQSSPLTVSTLARNDMFLFWYSSCTNSSLSGNITDEIINNDPFQLRPDVTVHETSRADFCRIRYGDKAKQYTQFLSLTPPNNLEKIYDSRTDEPIIEKVNYTEISYEWYRNKQAVATQSNIPSSYENWATVTNVNDGRQMNNYDNLPVAQSYGRYENDFAGQNTLDMFKKYKKWSQNEPDVAATATTTKKHVGLHNGDSIQRVISTGTLAPSLKSYSENDQLPVDGSIDIIFATYSFPPSSNVRLMSDAMRTCVQSYLAQEKELRLINDNSPFKQMNYDHDAYEAAINEICSKKTVDDQTTTMTMDDDPVKMNDWIREMGSMTVHRVNLKCFDKIKQKQIPIKEYKYQRWPSYLGIMADSVANVIDE
ncbi:pqq-like domain containing protein [Dermatophagoides farinae]|uniref:Pqq-like domain containing protein n=1 Tax=Dermatophagoides farinae TaxID=6954 RepID=A0A9D4NZX3_DERFA|nr:pqq-like domain containing protein [Dermatophagoides farinae]